LPSCPIADEGKTLLQKVGAYGHEVSRVEASAAPVSLEPLLERGNQLAAELKPIIEELPTGDYEHAVRDMKGFVVNRDEVVLVEPDARFFSTLARKVGTDQDRAYFGFMVKVAPEGYWPIYVVRQTDVGGCTDYGTGTLSKLYAEGTETASKLGPYYRREVEKTLGDIARQLTGSTCACGDLESVVQELRTFLATSPRAAPAAAVRARLASIERGERVMRTECVGGR
jgi:hypothetical protein